MKHFRPANNLYALLLIVLTLSTLAHSLVLTKIEFTSHLEQVVCTESLTDNDSDEHANMDDCKPPKHSFIDYSTSLSPEYFISTYNPITTKLQMYEPTQANPKVYLEIIVPPDSLA